MVVYRFLWYNLISKSQGYRKPGAGRNHSSIGHRGEKGITVTYFLRRVPGREPECDTAGGLFQIYEEKIWRRKKDFSHEPIASSLSKVGIS